MAEQFNQAVSALLQHSDPASRQQANSWLEQWQQTTQAWSVATEVLEHSSSIDAQYFAAQTLRTKVRCPPQHANRCLGHTILAPAFTLHLVFISYRLLTRLRYHWTAAGAAGCRGAAVARGAQPAR